MYSGPRRVTEPAAATADGVRCDSDSDMASRKAMRGLDLDVQLVETVGDRAVASLRAIRFRPNRVIFCDCGVFIAIA